MPQVTDTMIAHKQALRAERALAHARTQRELCAVPVTRQDVFDMLRLLKVMTALAADVTEDDFVKALQQHWGIEA